MKHILSSGSKLNLIPIKIEDQKTLFALMNEVYRHSYRQIWKDEGEWYVNLIYGLANVEKELSSTPAHYFFVEWKGEKIGILKYDFPFSPSQISIFNAMKIHRLYLHSKAHGSGIASMLMKHCEDIAKEHQLETIWLEVMEFQVQAKRFYEKCGYVLEYTYQLDFERIFPGYRGIEIWRKEI
jgi:diamine N-acetyltransferase